MVPTMAKTRVSAKSTKRSKPYHSRRPRFKSSAILSYTESDLAIMGRCGNWKMAQAARLLEKMTTTERALHEIFQSDRFRGQPCYPQTIAFGYIVDFYFPLVGLAVEADGPIHDTQKPQDRLRDKRLRERGITTLRIKNKAFHDDPAAVISTIERKIAKLKRLILS